MARSRLFRGRVREASVNAQLIDSGAAGTWGLDPIDGDMNYRPAGYDQAGYRVVPYYTLERARQQSVMVYRVHPMGRAIIDTYVAFCVGDTGVHPESPVPAVKAVLDEFWSDPLVDLGENQERWLRSHLLYGESLIEGIVGELFGSVRLRPIDVTAVQSIGIRDNNPLWPEFATLSTTTGPTKVPIIAYDDATGRLVGTAFFRADWQSVASDVRGLPFLTPSLDWLAAYDRTLSNLVDRTALARYFVWDVTVQGEQEDVDKFIDRQGMDPPESGTMNVHNDAVAWEPKTASSGSQEDTMTALQVLTAVSAGTGLAKTWLAEPEGSNRATGVSMAEPVRRRVQSVQRMWRQFMLTICRFVVDEAVRVGRLPRFVTIPATDGAETITVPTWRTVRVEMPEIAATDAQINATVLGAISAAAAQMVPTGMLGPEAARRLVEQAWSAFMGQPWRPGLDDDASFAAWKDQYGAAPPAPAPPAGAMPGVDNSVGTPGQNPPQQGGQQTVNNGSPVH